MKTPALFARRRGAFVGRLASVTALLAALVLVSGCARFPAGGNANNYRSPVIPPPGFLFSQVAAPLDIYHEGSPTIRSDGSGLKRGELKTSYLRVPFFWLDFAWGEADVAQAARQGRIETVHYADYEHFSVLGIYAEYRLRVYGE
jgi:hypothetical protein